jgi:uncharacterized glyoxalase superfamily protein PhnB
MGAELGERTLFAALHYDDSVAAATCLERAFGFVRGLVVEADGVVRHGEYWLGHSCLMIGGSPQEGGYWGDHSQCTCAFISDVDAHYEQAKAAGATVLAPPADTAYGARGYYTADCEGFVWGFSNYRPRR